MKLSVHSFSKWLLVVGVMFFLTNMTLAQRSITGKVTDSSTGDPLIGANILVVGTSSGTVTDFDGNYTLDLPEGASEIEVTYTGFGSKRVAVTSSDVLDIQLSPGELLDEVVVIGYGTAKKSDLTGSVSSVDAEDFNKGLVTAPDQLIQGRAPGVQLVNNSGQPGGGTTIRIRGNSSIRAGNQPLFVVDGVQLSGSSTKPGGGVSVGGGLVASNPLNYLNPNDIESIQILKDASATAIYGSRGANGVILITTKKGRSGDPTIEFSAQTGFSNILKKYDVLDGNEYRQALSDYGLTGGDFGDNVDAFDEILRTGVVHNHTISINGGGNKGNYRVSLGYLNQEGIVKSNSLERVNANISGSYKFMDDDRLSIDFNLITSYSLEDGPSVSTSAGFRGSLIGNALQWNPTHRLYEPDGSLVIIPEFGNFTNPLALIEAYEDETSTVDVLASISPSYRITDWLTYKFSYNVTHGVGSRRGQIASWINLENIQDRGIAGFNEKTTTNQILTHTLSINKDLSSNISFSGLLGYEYQKFDEKELGFSAQDFIVEEFDYTNIFQNTTQGSRSLGSGAAPIAELQSYFARANVNISDKYLLTATIRADGSSKFGENNRYGYFPAVALAWNLTNEDFLANGPFDNLKLRLGWGQTGNQAFDAGASQDRYGFGLQSLALENVANPDLKWETTTTINAGIDFALFDYRLTGSIDYFSRESEDLLFQFPTIQPAPAGFYWINLDGQVVNSGVELALNGAIVDKQNVSWDVGINATFISNEVQDYNGPVLDYAQLFGQGISGATSQRLASGRPLNSWYLRQHIGIGEDGQSQFVNNEELAFVGDPNPDVLLGISSNLRVGDFSLGLNFNGSYGADIYNNTKNTVIPIGNLGTRNIDANLLGGENQEAISNAIKGSSRYLESGDYLKLANATLAYNLGNLFNGTFKDARVFISGNNLFVITDYTGFDPEVNTVNTNNTGLPSAGIEYIPYPSARTVMFGLNFKL